MLLCSGSAAAAAYPLRISTEVDQGLPDRLIEDKPIVPLDSSIFNFVDAYEVRDRVEDRARTLRALARINTQSMEVGAGQKTAKDAADEIRATVTREMKFDPATFASVSRALQPLDSDVESATQTLRTFGSLALLGLPALLANPVSAGETFLLGSLGVLADDAVRSFGPGLISGHLPSPSDQEVLGLSSWANNHFARLAAQSPAAAQLAEALHKNGTVTIDLSAPLETTIRKLPPSLRNSLGTIGDISKADSAQIRAAFVSALNSEFKHIDRSLDEFTDRIEKEISPILQQYERQRRLESIQETVQDINSIGLIGNFLFRALRCFVWVTELDFGRPGSATLRLFKNESDINGILPAGGGPLPIISFRS
jgi:hypothetical protein